MRQCELIIFDIHILNPFIWYLSGIEFYQLITFYIDIAFLKLSYLITQIFCEIYAEGRLEFKRRLQLQKNFDRLGLIPVKCSQIRDF